MPLRRGYWFVLLAAAVWGTTGTAQALGPEAATPMTVGALRMIIGGTGLAVVAAASGRLPARRSWLTSAVLLAGAAMAAYQPLFFTGVAQTGVAVGTLVAIGTAPILAGFMALVAKREVLSRRWTGSTALALVGLIMLLVKSEATRVEPGGFVAALGAGLAYATYAVAAKGVIERYGTVTALTLTFGWAALLSVPLLALGSTDWLGDDRGTLLVLYLGLITTTVAYLLFARGLALTPVGTATTLTLAEPAVAALLALTVLSEHLDPLSWAGLALLVTALLNLGMRSPLASAISGDDENGGDGAVEREAR